MKRTFNSESISNKELQSKVVAENIVINPWFQQDLKFWTIVSGSPTIVSEYENNWFSFTENISSQAKQTISLLKNHKYYVSVTLSVTRADAGKFGLQLYGSFDEGESITVGTQRVTNGYKTYSKVITSKVDTKQSNIYVGSLFSANGVGKVGKITMMDLTELFGKGEEPDVTVFENLDIPFKPAGISLSVKELFKIIYKSSKLTVNGSLCTDEQAEALFIDAMNRKCKLLGMKNSTFINSHGLEVAGQLSSSRDMLKLSVHACGYSELLKVWGAKQYAIYVRGEHERIIQLRTTVVHSELSSAYTILGGKTGTLTTGGDAYNLVSVLSNNQGKVAVGVTMGAVGEDAKNKRFTAMKQLVDYAFEKAKKSDFAENAVYDSHSGSMVFLPENSPLMYTHAPLPSFCSINEDDPIRPASLTKILTALILLDNIKNLNESFSIKHWDLVGGSGPKLCEGDRLTFSDALYLMMLPSSNNTAKAIARVVGRKIAETQG